MAKDEEGNEEVIVTGEPDAAQEFRFRVPREVRLFQDMALGTGNKFPIVRQPLAPTRWEDEDWEPAQQVMSEVLPGLFIGNLDDAAKVREFDLTVNVSGVSTPREAHGKMHVDWPLSDAAYIPNTAMLWGLARLVADVYRRDTTSRIFIHCAMGWNRSGLVMSLAVMLIKQVAGVDAVGIVRKARGDYALCNAHFEQYVKTRRRPRKPLGRGRKAGR